MILCVNANAALDKTVVVSPFRLNTIHRPQQVLALPGGKGANAARALQCLGELPIVAGWVGGFTGRFIESGLRQEDIETAFVHLAAESRTCLSILDPANGTLTEIYERGEPIPADKISELKDVVRARMADCTALLLSGSLPPGVPTDFYAELIASAHTAGVPTFLDSSGAPLKRGLEVGQPFLIKPNAQEFAELVGHEPATRADLTQAAVALSTGQATIVVLSLGAEGALVANGSQVFAVRPPPIAGKSAVGSGDCLLAGIAYGLTHGLALPEAARYGVAAGTANALTLGAGRFSPDDFSRILAQVIITPP